MTGVVARSDPQMSVIAQSNHPARLLTMFGGALAFAAIVASALYAAIWMVQDMRAPETVTRTIGSGDITASGGVQVVLPLETADEFEQLAGFAPFVPERVPANTIGDPKYAVTPPDAEGHRVGRVAFSSKPDAAVNGITGPVIVIAEAQGKPGAGVDGELKQVTAGGARALVATLPCGDLVVDVQLYFGPEAAAGEDVVTPYMMTTAQGFLADVRDQCER
jgi:hypothetical protein